MYQNTYLGYGKPQNGKILYVGFREGGDFIGNFFHSNPTTVCPYTYCRLTPCNHTSCRIRIWEDNFKTNFVDLSDQINYENAHVNDHILHFPFGVKTWTNLNIISMSAERLITSLNDRHTPINIPITPNNYSPYHSIPHLSKHEAYHQYKMFQNHSNDCIAHITLPFLPNNLRITRANSIMSQLCNAISNYQWKAIVVYAKNQNIRNLLNGHCGFDISTFSQIPNIQSINQGEFNSIPIFNFVAAGGAGQPSHEALFELGQIIQDL